MTKKTTADPWIMQYTLLVFLSILLWQFCLSCVCGFSFDPFNITQFWSLSLIISVWGVMIWEFWVLLILIIFLSKSTDTDHWSDIDLKITVSIYSYTKLIYTFSILTFIFSIGIHYDNCRCYQSLLFLRYRNAVVQLHVISICIVRVYVS